MPKESPPRNLGVLFDSGLTFGPHVAKSCRSMTYNLMSIRKVRNLLSKADTEKLVNALVTSRLDYCNGLLAGATQCVIKPLQMVQNHAARVVSLSRKFDHVTPTLNELHWLPVRQRTYFKVLLFTFKALNGKAPIYIDELLDAQMNTHIDLRSNSKELLSVPTVKTCFGERSFSYMSPRLWNNLPIEIRQSTSVDIFKQTLKTFLFNNPDFPQPLII